MRFWLTLSFLLFLSASVRGEEAAPAKPLARDAGGIEFDPDWTPRPIEGDVPAYVKETDVDWLDSRLREMDTGRTFNATFKYRHGEPGTSVPGLEGRGPRAAGRVTGRPANRAQDGANGQEVTVYKGTSVRVGEKGEAAWLFDRNQLRWACVWECEPFTEPTSDNPTGFTPYLNHNDRRFGLLNTPTPKGEIVFSTGPGAGFTDRRENWKPETPPTTTLPRQWGRYLGMDRGGPRTAILVEAFPKANDPTARMTWFDMPWVHHIDGVTIHSRALRIANLSLPMPNTVLIEVLSVPGCTVERHDREGFQIALIKGEGQPIWVSLWDADSDESECILQHVDDRLVVEVDAISAQAVLCIIRGDGLDADKFARLSSQVLESEKPDALMHKIIDPQLARAKAPGAPNPLAFAPDWPQDIRTRGIVAEDSSAYVVDTLTLPYDNPYRALLFVSGVDFLHDGRAVVTTVHGDVWLVDGIGSTLEELRWKRFATGLYQPLGVKVVNDEIYVVERGQLTILRDQDGNGECDEQECFNGDWHVGGSEHSFHTSLEQDLDGNFYFHCGGDIQSPTGGTLMQVSADGKRAVTYATGFRHPIGLGSLPDGRITGADQEGNWMPSTRVDIYKAGGFYGDMRTHHRNADPKLYDGPLCWLPRQLDGSAGGEVFVNRDDFGPLSRRLLHMSYGNCRLMLLLLQEHAGVAQAGAIDLGLQFLSGIQRGRFRDSDGCLYLAGMDGWQTAAQADGCLQRVRYTGKPCTLPVALSLERGGIKIEFNTPLDTALASDTRRYHLEQWNYLWTGEYGSHRWSAAHPDQEGQDEVSIESATVEGPATVFLKVPHLGPVMQMQIEYDLADASGQPVKGTLYNTIHTTGPAVELRDGDRIALIGGTLVEREQRYGYWEHAITAAHPDKQLIFRNLGWSADTVSAESRGIFDPADKGYERLIEQARELKPTVLVLNYGQNEAWQGEHGLAGFIERYGKLIDDLITASGAAANGGREPAVDGQRDNATNQTAKQQGTDVPRSPRVVLVGPLPMESGVGPNKHPDEYNANVALYTAAIAKLARERDLPFIDLAEVYPWHEQQPSAPGPDGKPQERRSLTDNGLHLSAYGYWRTAPWIRERLCAGTTAPTLLEGGKPVCEVLPAAGKSFQGEWSSLPQPPLEERLDAPPTAPDEVTVSQDLAVKGARGDFEQSLQLLDAIRRKNELYFHRWRPQNVTYLFLFRKHEQGQNAAEIPQFDPLIEAAEQEIATLRAPREHAFSR